MSKKTYKTLETPRGNGEIRKSAEHFANVSYRIQIKQEIFIDETFGDKAEIPGQLVISGEVIVSAEERMTTKILNGMASGKLLILCLSDGRKLEVIANAIDQLKGIYRVVPGPSGFIA